MYRYKVKHNPFRRLKMAFKSRKRTRGNIFLGVVTTILASLSFTAMSACAKALAPISSEEMTFFRGLVGLIFIPLLTLQTKEPFFTGKYKFMLSLRGFFGSAALLFYFLSIEGMTLGDSQILSQLAAFFMCILSPIFLKEKLPKEAIPGLVVIALGTLCVVQIWNFDSFNVYALFGIGGGFFSAAAYIVISMLAERDFKSNTEIVFYFQIFSIAVGAALMKGSFTMPEGIQWVWLIGLGLFALSAQMFMTWAFQHVNSLIVSFLCTVKSFSMFFSAGTSGMKYLPGHPGSAALLSSSDLSCLWYSNRKALTMTPITTKTGFPSRNGKRKDLLKTLPLTRKDRYSGRN